MRKSPNEHRINALGRQRRQYSKPLKRPDNASFKHFKHGLRYALKDVQNLNIQKGEKHVLKKEHTAQILIQE